MNRLPVLAKDEINELCSLHAFIQFLEEEIKRTKFKRWKDNFSVMHKTCKDMMMERWLCFKDGGALKRISDEVVGAKVLITQKGKNYVKGNEEEFKHRVSADDMYKLGEIAQSSMCQKCYKRKDTCELYEIFRKNEFEKFNPKARPGICPYSVIV